MNCNDIRKYFYAFIDNELDVEKNIEILAHLDMCYECSQKMERERLLHERTRYYQNQPKTVLFSLSGTD